ncbi:guanitoxin biosynthesis heme-dependent pre-guanitoxin N-hydroxylase GntA [Devosia sediminis]|uniref:YqcI/YcgG family protein n=1 Tax=Devosia sediminis TaxID=2798801 RepID=A0A934MK38_9HYPH|nr:guanitoxin biosynthesis heme-dependent pre-guanitoxin N-hydroxylase GntA [Devosia sediminis]MBJ3783735.1 YqcI/YcgG family protein [Devosia sediminis]
MYSEKTVQSPLEKELEDFILANDFPCVGAKSALRKGQLTTYVAHSLASAWNDVEIHDRLMQFAWAYQAEPTLFTSFAVIYEQPVSLTEAEFEQFMWERLQSLTEKDGWRGQRPDPRVSADPNDPHFSLSFGGEAFFVVGMHPHASRPARRFSHPVMVFNLHDQFETLREENRYEKLRASILARDEDLAGSINPMLARHGESSEARQYSGRQVSDEWACPFHRPKEALAAVDPLAAVEKSQ